MPRDTTRLLYLARHAEPSEPEAGGVGGGDHDAVTDALSPIGVRQAEMLGRRLAALPVERLVHGPLPRAAATARVVAAHLGARPGLVPEVEAWAGDYVPHVPGPGEVPEPWAAGVEAFVGGVDEAEAADGERLGREALDRLAAPAVDGRARTEVVVTHAFTIGWLLAHALGAPPWRWYPPAQCHTGLTVLRYEVGTPPCVVLANDMGHLPAELRWTGFPDRLRA